MLDRQVALVAVERQQNPIGGVKKGAAWVRAWAGVFCGARVDRVLRCARRGKHERGPALVVGELGLGDKVAPGAQRRARRVFDSGRGGRGGGGGSGGEEQGEEGEGEGARRGHDAFFFRWRGAVCTCVRGSSFRERGRFGFANAGLLFLVRSGREMRANRGQLVEGGLASVPPQQLSVPPALSHQPPRPILRPSSRPDSTTHATLHGCLTLPRPSRRRQRRSLGLLAQTRRLLFLTTASAPTTAGPASSLYIHT